LLASEVVSPQPLDPDAEELSDDELGSIVLDVELGSIVLDVELGSMLVDVELGSMLVDPELGWMLLDVELCSVVFELELDLFVADVETVPEVAVALEELPVELDEPGPELVVDVVPERVVALVGVPPWELVPVVSCVPPSALPAGIGGSSTPRIASQPLSARSAERLAMRSPCLRRSVLMEPGG